METYSLDGRFVCIYFISIRQGIMQVCMFALYMQMSHVRMYLGLRLQGEEVKLKNLCRLKGYGR